MLISFIIQEILREILNGVPVDVARLDEIIKKNNIAMRDEHRNFIINLGNCNKILNNGFGNFTLNRPGIVGDSTF